MRFNLALFLFLPIFSHAQTCLTPGMKIQSSIVIEKKEYKFAARTNLSTPLIEISGNDIVVDFNGAMLKGNKDNELPNQYHGLAILIHDAKNVTIKNLNARGYKVAVMARNVESLTIEECNLSYNYRQRLNSTQEKEDISDWMSYHHNENDEWLRYGSAMYLRNCNNARIHLNRVTGGQCALMMTECNNCLIERNDFSYNSGIGIGMYKSNKNYVAYNKVDFNIRGFSFGIYNRGQDSAAILVFEQCNGNYFLSNTATHSGDGFFLWAGQTTMDTGLGGCNDNFLFRNDFSNAATNGIEVTFSRNVISQNQVVDCDNGIWAGYSYETLIADNVISRNNIGIAIEHGQNNRIYGNYFQMNKESIRLWARKSQPSDWGYAAKRDTRSRDYSIVLNRFTWDSLIYNLKYTTNIRLDSNLADTYKKLFLLDSTTAASLDTSRINSDWERSIEELRSPDGGLPDRNQIKMTEWGPYDFRYPLVWRTNPTDTSGVLRFDVIGPPGKWKLISTKGIRDLSNASGEVPASLTASRIKGSKEEILVELEFVGQELTDQFGKMHSANTPYHFKFRDSRVPIQWRVNWYAFDSTLNPIKIPADWNKITAQQPLLQQESHALDYAWWGGLNVKGRPYERFVTVAKAALDLSPGSYELSTTWDDAVRVYLDGKLIINEWNPSKYTFDESPNKTIQIQLSGQHQLRVEHVELGGFATINLKLKKL